MCGSAHRPFIPFPAGVRSGPHAAFIPQRSSTPPPPQPAVPSSSHRRPFHPRGLGASFFPRSLGASFFILFPLEPLQGLLMHVGPSTCGRVASAHAHCWHGHRPASLLGAGREGLHGHAADAAGEHLALRGYWQGQALTVPFLCIDRPAYPSGRTTTLRTLVDRTKWAVADINTFREMMWRWIEGRSSQREQREAGTEHHRDHFDRLLIEAHLSPSILR